MSKKYVGAILEGTLEHSKQRMHLLIPKSK